MIRQDRRISERRTTWLDLTVNNIDEKLADIDNMIRRENDEEKRNVLLVLHCLTSTLSVVSRVLEELEKHNSDRFDTQEARIAAHDTIVQRNKAVWNTSIFFGSVIQTMLMAAAIYGGTLFTELQRSVAVNSNRILVLEQHFLQEKSHANL